MDKRQAQQQIHDIFQNGFQRETYQHFIRNLLNQVEARDSHYSGNLIPEAFKEHINQYWRIGKYVDPDSTELDLLVVEVKSLAKLDRARTSLRNFAVNRLRQFDKDCSLIAFYAKEDEGADWRFSFVKIEHGAFQDDNGKVKLKTELTPAKRYSYLVGVHENSHTAQDQLLDLLVMDANPKIDDIEKAFSIEKVTAEFFEQYKGLYLKLSEQLTGQPFFQKGTDTEKDQAVARFAKKLLGQIVFLYFLQKKGWLGADQGQAWSTGPRKFMRQRFNKTVAAGGNYYHDFLQYLFYEALADDRKGQTDPDYYPRFTCKIPFLNGGLFEAEYDWQSQAIALPDSIFHNDNKNKAGDEGTGILDVFDRYNFTIKEDEPLEKEVAVDPEMLGKVFENMLDGTERKSKGAFYTPREIVHYMCQESLIYYLDTSTNISLDKTGQRDLLTVMQRSAARVPKDDIETLIRKGHLFVENDEAALQALQRIESGEQKTTKHKVELPESVKINAKLIDDKLANIKVCDPAIGSGAFPVGLLHEIITARLALAPHSGNQWSAYDLKRHTIRESLYGVDIDPSAIDIARLRLWLSLIVDEEDFSSIEALPNLDYKIMQGNSLIEEYWGVKLFNEEFIQEDDWNEAKIRSLQERQRAIDAEGLALYRDNQLTADKERQLGKEIKGIVKSIKALRAPKDKTPPRGLFDIVTEAKRKAGQLEQLHKDFFSACSPERKKEIRDQITTLEWELIEATLAEQNQLDSLEKLQQIKQSGEKPFFLWKLNFPEVFKEKGGFDVVIGNPPYVRADRSEEHSALRKAILSSNQYETLWEKWDLYIPFIEKGYQLLRDGGVSTMIVSDAYCHAKYAQKSQEWFLKNSRVLRLDFFSKIQLFDAGVRNITYFFQKADGSRHRPERCVHAPGFGNVTCLATDEQRKLDFRAFFPEDSATEVIIESISLDHLCYITKGMVVNADEKVAKGAFKMKDLVVSQRDDLHSKPFVEGKHIDKWLSPSHEWLEWGTNRAPNLFSRPTFPELYAVEEKILVQRSPGPDPKACFDNIGLHFTESSVGFIPWHALTGVRNRSIQKKARYQDEKSPKSGTPRREDLEAVSRRFSVKYLLSVMNSSMTRDMLRKHRRSNIHLYPDDWKQLPIPNIPKESQKPFYILVDYILAVKVQISLKLQSAYFEQLIDGLVYELYFAAELKAANKEILKHLGDLTAITDAMSDEEKLAIIQTEFDRLYDPRHPVRNHLETLDSVEEVRIIREALKR